MSGFSELTPICNLDRSNKGERKRMCSIDYLTPFVEVGRALADGADLHSVMDLITRRTTSTLNLKGCLIRMKGTQGDRLEILASSGLSENFLFSEPMSSPGSICFQLPDSTVCFPRLQNEDFVAEQELMMIEGIRALAVVPIEVEQQAIAMVALFAGEPREFSKNELSFAEALAGRGIMAIVWGRRIDSLMEEERQYLRSFQEVSSTINSTLQIGKVLELVVTKVTQVLGANGCAVRLLDPKTQNLYLAQAHGLSKEFLNKGPVDSQKSIAENAAGKIIVINDVLSDPRLQYPAETAEEGVRKLLSIPLMVRGKFIGVLRVFTGERPPFKDREISFATAIAQQCAFAIENARIYQRVKYEYQQLLVDFDYDGSSQ
jgi:GAF domain-containing protein